MSQTSQEILPTSEALPLHPTESAKRRDFRKLYEEVRALVSSDKSTPAALDFYRAVRTYAEIIRENPDLDGRETDLLFLKTEMRKLGLHCKDPKVSEHFQDGDIIEIYDPKHFQLFRNFEYFRHSSYSVYAMMTSSWPSLFEREDEILASIERDLMKVFYTDGRQPHNFDTPAHVLKERGGKQYRFLNKLRTGWLLTNEKDEAAGYIILHSVRKLNPEKVRHLG